MMDLQHTLLFVGRFSAEYEFSEKRQIVEKIPFNRISFWMSPYEGEAAYSTDLILESMNC